MGESVPMANSSSEVSHLPEDQQFHGPLASAVGRVFELVLIVAIAGPTLWFAARAWPYDGGDLLFFGGGLAFDAFLLWHLILSRPRQVSLSRETVELRRYVGNESIPIASIDAATSDPIGQAQLRHAGGKSRLGLAGPELQRFLTALRERKPDVRVKGLGAS